MKKLDVRIHRSNKQYFFLSIFHLFLPYWLLLEFMTILYHKTEKMSSISTAFYEKEKPRAYWPLSSVNPENCIVLLFDAVFGLLWRVLAEFDVLARQVRQSGAIYCSSRLVRFAYELECRRICRIYIWILSEIQGVISRLNRPKFILIFHYNTLAIFSPIVYKRWHFILFFLHIRE